VHDLSFFKERKLDVELHLVTAKKCIYYTAAWVVYTHTHTHTLSQTPKAVSWTAGCTEVIRLVADGISQ